MIISKTFKFEASHILPKHPGKCSRLHGHSWNLTVEVEGAPSIDTGFVMDYADLSSIVQAEVVRHLDHKHLGAWPQESLPWFHLWAVPFLPKEFYPSSENLIFKIGEILTQVKWSTLVLCETCTSQAILRREEFDYAVKEREEQKDHLREHP